MDDRYYEIITGRTPNVINELEGRTNERQPWRLAFWGLSGSESLDSMKRPLRHLLLIVYFCDCDGVTLTLTLFLFDLFSGLLEEPKLTPGFLSETKQLYTTELLIPWTLQLIENRMNTPLTII